MADLTEKQKRFCEEYLIDNNATQAAIRSGMEGDYGRHLLTLSHVLEEIARLKAARSARLGIDADWVLQRFIDISNRCIQAEPVLIFDGEKWIESGEYKFDSNGANKATENIAKHIGFYAKDKEKPQDTKKAKKRFNVTINVPYSPPKPPDAG